jgi:hypothetical protein
MPLVSQWSLAHLGSMPRVDCGWRWLCCQEVDGTYEFLTLWKSAFWWCKCIDVRMRMYVVGCHCLMPTSICFLTFYSLYWICRLGAHLAYTGRQEYHPGRCHHWCLCSHNHACGQCEKRHGFSSSLISNLMKVLLFKPFPQKQRVDLVGMVWSLTLLLPSLRPPGSACSDVINQTGHWLWTCLYII